MINTTTCTCTHAALCIHSHTCTHTCLWSLICIFIKAVNFIYYLYISIYLYIIYLYMLEQIPCFCNQLLISSMSLYKAHLIYRAHVCVFLWETCPCIHIIVLALTPLALPLSLLFIPPSLSPSDMRCRMETTKDPPGILNYKVFTKPLIGSLPEFIVRWMLCSDEVMWPMFTRSIHINCCGI